VERHGVATLPTLKFKGEDLLIEPGDDDAEGHGLLRLLVLEGGVDDELLIIEDDVLLPHLLALLELLIGRGHLSQCAEEEIQEVGLVDLHELEGSTGTFLVELVHYPFVVSIRKVLP